MISSRQYYCAYISYTIFLIPLQIIFNLPVCCQSSINDPIILAEKQALLSFKNGISRDPLHILSSWSSSSTSFPCNSSWAGVNCNASRVTSLNLHSKNLTGTINGASLSNLTHLTYLNLSINSFSGSIPQQIGALAYLTQLDFKQNTLSGIIPPELGNCTSLIWLDLSRNADLHGMIPSSLGQLSNLYMLQLHNLPNLGGSIPPELGNLTNLEYMYLGQNNHSGIIPSELGKLVKLRQIYLMLNHFEGPMPPELGKLKNLEILNFFSNNLNGSIPREFGNLTSLQYLYLQENNISGAIPAELGKMQSMIDLELYSNKLSGPLPPELGKLKNLEILNFFSNNLNGSIPREFGNLTSLQHLYAQQNALSGDIPAELSKMQSIIELELYSNKLSGPFPVELDNLQYLSKLTLFSNQLTGQIPAEVGNLSKVTWLSIGDNHFHGSLPYTLGNLVHLEYFEVGQNNLSEQIPSTLGQLRNLSYLDLSRNHFSGTLPKELKNCTKLQIIKLGNNSLSGSLPIEFSLFTQLQTFSVTKNNLSGSLPETFGNRSSLVFLDFAYNRFSGNMPSNWSELGNLRVLSVAYNHLQGGLPSWLWKLDQLQVLELSNNAFSGSIPSDVRQMNGFKYNASGKDDDTLWNNDVSVDIKGRQNYYWYVRGTFISLDISGNQLSGSIPTEIGSMSGLVNLNLSRNNLTGPIPSSVGDLSVLESLDFSINMLSGEIPSQLASIKTLSFLNLSYNQLYGAIPRGPQFNTFTNMSYIGNKGLCDFPLLACEATTSPVKTSANNRRIIMIVVICISFFCVCVIVALNALRRKIQWFCFHNYRIEIFDKKIKRLSSKELSRAISGYSNASVVGRGGFSTVYRCELSNGMTVAIKKLDLHTHPLAEKSFQAEITTLGQIRHRNLVKILGTFTTKQMKCLILDYIRNGNLEMHLHTDGCDLNLNRRLNIALGVSHGLVYLHNDTGSGRVLHCDLKPSNILLDEDFEPRISDFGIAKLIDVGGNAYVSANYLQGSIGYVAPEFAVGERLTDKVDVYSFGVVLLEMLTGRRPTNEGFGDGKTLPAWVQEVLDEENWLETVVDPALINEMQEHDENQQQVQLLFKLALHCVEKNPRDRPAMKDVLDVLLRLKQGKPVVINYKEYDHDKVTKTDQTSISFNAGPTLMVSSSYSVVSITDAPSSN